MSRVKEEEEIGDCTISSWGEGMWQIQRTEMPVIQNGRRYVLVKK